MFGHGIVDDVSVCEAVELPTFCPIMNAETAMAAIIGIMTYLFNTLSQKVVGIMDFNPKTEICEYWL